MKNHLCEFLLTAVAF